MQPRNLHEGVVPRRDWFVRSEIYVITDGSDRRRLIRKLLLLYIVDQKQNDTFAPRYTPLLFVYTHERRATKCIIRLVSDNLGFRLIKMGHAFVCGRTILQRISPRHSILSYIRRIVGRW